MNKIRLLFFLLFIFNAVNVVAIEKGTCEYKDDAFLTKFYTTLYKEKDYKQSQVLLEEFTNCVNNDDSAAIYADLTGDLLRFLYRKTKDIKIARRSEKMYLEGLNLKTEREVELLWHLSLLMRDMGEMDESIKYINKVLEKKPKKPVKYLATALVISVKVGHWDQAKKLVDILYNKDQTYYLYPPLLLASVRTLCYYDKKDVAQKFVKNVEKIRNKLSPVDIIALDKAKELSVTCLR